ncbi:MAG: BMP family ABC transporter substrate-binding protein [Oscillospiraceae bacterium]|nr:BMP family ABC transporter substrate-binding protein [Oscillospiraceae bacterium]
MKKLISLLLALTLCFSLAACGGSKEEAKTETPAEEAAPAVEEAAPVEETAAVAVKAGLITLHDENSGYDKNFIDAFIAACEEVGAEYVIKSNIAEDQSCYDAACELADDGCNMIFSDSYGHQSYMLEAAQEFPEVQFTACTGDSAAAAALDNFHNAFANIYEGRFIAGVAAGLKINEMIDAGDITADEAKMGYVGAMPYAEVISGYTSFYLGARSVCPTVTMDVIYTGSWYDETLEKEGAESLIKGGAVLVSQHADSMGAPNACEAAGVPNVSYNGSTEAACPNTYIISSRINWAPYFVYAMNCVAEGTAIDTNWCGTTAQGAVALTELNEAVAAEGTAEKLEEVKAALADGSLKVFDCANWTVDGETLTTYDQVAFYEGNECIWDGYFHESETRSAPYFDLIIDGITLK